MKFIVIIALFASSLIIGIPQTHAQKLPIADESIVVETAPTLGSDQELLAELETLKAKESESGAFTRFIINLRIKQLENQLNIKKALE